MVMDFGNVMDDSEMQSVNAPLLIEDTDGGMYTDIRDTQPAIIVD